MMLRSRSFSVVSIFLLAFAFSLFFFSISHSSDLSESSCSISYAEKIFREVFRPSPSTSFSVLSATPIKAGDIVLCEVIYRFAQNETYHGNNGSDTVSDEQESFKQVFYYTPDGKVLIAGDIIFKENGKWLHHTRLLLRTINSGFLRKLGIEMKNLSSNETN